MNNGTTAGKTQVRRPETAGWSALLPLCLAACSGQIGATDHGPADSQRGGEDGTSSGGNGGGPSVAPGDVPVRPDDVPVQDCTTLDVGGARLQRITREQYNRSVKDVLGDASNPATRFSPDERPGIFFANHDAAITDAVYQHYVEAAETVADGAALRFDTLAPCDASKRGDEICAREVLSKLGRRLYRRPLDAGQLDRLLAVYRAARGGAPAVDHKTALRDALAAALQSPHFLYLEEGGTPLSAPGVAAGVERLDGFSIAARLATFFWSSAPDDVLLDAAAAGTLASSDGIAAQAARLLADPRAGSAIASFSNQWLQLERLDRSIVDAALRASIGNEITGFVARLYQQSGGTVSDLLLSRSATLDAATANIYGAPGSAAGATVELMDAQRAGLLTRAGFLASSRGVPARGKFVLTHLLCQSIELPADVDTTLAPRQASENPRQHFDRHRADPQCTGCHQILDPIGHTFWHYDQQGRFVNQVDGWTVDAQGAVTGTSDADGDVDGAVELSQRLAGSADVGACLARQWFAFALRREPDDERDRCSLGLLAARQSKSAGSLRDMLLTLPLTDAFTHVRRFEN